MKKDNILIVDDNKEMLEMLDDALSDDYYIEILSSGDKVGEKLSKTFFDLVITDIKMGEFDGFMVLDKVKKISPDTEVIMMTAFGSLESAIKAIKLGAFDYITKPFKISTVRHTIQKALERKRLEEENTRLIKLVKERYSFYNIIGKTPCMQTVYDLIEKVSKVDSNVIIEGESGTGKELVARAIHFNGRSAKKPYIAINCAAIPENLLESELFGHTKGSFTGATQSKKGLFLEADKGTLFLDEIGDMSIMLQSKLLRVLEEKTIRAVGSTQNIPINVKIISATNRNLEEEVKKGNFREDLYYRLNVIKIKLPPLRDRKEDIPLLLKFFIEKYSEKNNKKIESYDNSFIQCLLNYYWPGNVRELENIIERAVALSEGKILTGDDLPIKNCNTSYNKVNNNFFSIEELLPLEEIKIRYINRVLEEVNGNKEKAARLLGISKRTLYRKEDN